MIQYTISCANRLSQNIQIRLFFEVNGKQIVELGLPAWRPGRYEFQTYARNIFGVRAYDRNKTPLSITKTARNTWTISDAKEGPVEIFYEYTCAQFDAGGSWIDDTLIYINPINCLFYVKGREEEPCSLNLNLPDTSSVASNLPFVKGAASAEHYFRLADSPFFISKQQAHQQYQVDDTTYHIWTHGDIAYDRAALLKHFTAFTRVQVTCMESFPEKEYHFLLLLLPFTHYHGVEHQQSTVITLGPAQDLAKYNLYEELISISSHELYHAWNICKIRPSEMLPYRLHEENYFRTGFVAEGITTYLGEYFLRKSGFFSEERFLLEIEQWLNRHRLHRGLERASLSDSSFDLWVDGYIGSSSDYKVSIYVAGALSAIALDLKIRLANSEQSIFNLMRNLYQKKALQSEGYTETDIRHELQALLGQESEVFWGHCIEGHSIEEYVVDTLLQFGISVYTITSPLTYERILGLKLKTTVAYPEIAKIQFGSPGASYFMPDDIILSVNHLPVNSSAELESQLKNCTQIEFLVRRKGREVKFEINLSSTTNYWSTLHVEKNKVQSDDQSNRYQSWLQLQF